jgi:hypothetical protein
MWTRICCTCASLSAWGEQWRLNTVCLLLFGGFGVGVCVFGSRVLRLSAFFFEYTLNRTNKSYSQRTNKSYSQRTNNSYLQRTNNSYLQRTNTSYSQRTNNSYLQMTNIIIYTYRGLIIQTQRVLWMRMLCSLLVGSCMCLIFCSANSETYLYIYIYIYSHAHRNMCTQNYVYTQTCVFVRMQYIQQRPQRPLCFQQGFLSMRQLQAISNIHVHGPLWIFMCIYTCVTTYICVSIHEHTHTKRNCL